MSSPLPLATRLVAGRDWTGFDHLRVYMIIGAANSAFTLIRAFSFAYGGVCGAISAHDRLLASGAHTLLREPMCTLGVLTEASHSMPSLTDASTCCPAFATVLSGGQS